MCVMVVGQEGADEIFHCFVAVAGRGGGIMCC